MSSLALRRQESLGDLQVRLRPPRCRRRQLRHRLSGVPSRLRNAHGEVAGAPRLLEVAAQLLHRMLSACLAHMTVAWKHLGSLLLEVALRLATSPSLVPGPPGLGDERRCVGFEYAGVASTRGVPVR